jgi:D-xylose 1-dehydrogenase
LAAHLTPEAQAMISDNQCLPGRVVPADVARLLLWLAADDAAAVTGQTLAVNAGWV